MIQEHRNKPLPRITEIVTGAVADWIGTAEQPDDVTIVLARCTGPVCVAARDTIRAMNYRALGRTGWKVSEISFGAWAIGGAWGQVTDEESLGALNQAIDSGINFLDTADVYGNGRSHRLIGQLKKARKEEIIVATKVGRRLPKQTVEGYSRANLTSWVEDNLLDLERRGPRPGTASLPADRCLLSS